MLRWLGSQLLKTNTLHKIGIQLQFKRFEPNCWAGYCHPVNRWNYQIVIQPNMGKKNIMWVICHEMVHVKQYAKKELKPLGSTLSMYKQKEYDEKVVPYNNRPWEIEAQKLDVVLCKRYKRYLESNNITF